MIPEGTIRSQITRILKDILQGLAGQFPGQADDLSDEPIVLERPKNREHGDFSTNLAMQLIKNRKIRGVSPAQIAEVLIENIIRYGGDIIDKVDMAGPGFINFSLKRSVWCDELASIHKADSAYGQSKDGLGKRVHIEFVSANPTGPLHVGHGRGAVVGDVLANLFEKAGYGVVREYYINDFGSQIRVLGDSVRAYARHIRTKEAYQPEEGWYQGDYIAELAREIVSVSGEETDAEACGNFAATRILENQIKPVLIKFGVKPFDRYVSEKALYAGDSVKNALEELKTKGCLAERDGALWFTSEKFGDEKDRVVIRENGQPTYLASDIAYHKKKFSESYDCVVDIWGADHHGYVARIKGSLEALGYDSGKLAVILVQIVNLKRDGHPVKMSKRLGQYVTLEEVINEVGRDAARFTFLTRRSNSHLDFDLELVKKKTLDNPVYYLQYAYARTCNIFEHAKESGIISKPASADLTLLTAEEISLIKIMAQYQETIQSAIAEKEPYYFVDFLLNLAKEFHGYYNKVRVVTDNRSETEMRLYVVGAVQIILRDALAVLGVDAPKRM